MRGVLFVVLIFHTAFGNCQSITEKELLKKHFFVENFDSPLPLYFDKGDSIILKRGVKLEGFYFDKKNRLKMVRSFKWCGQVFIFERIWHSIFGRVKYRKYSNESYQYLPETKILMLKFNGDIHYCELWSLDFIKTELDSLSLVVKRKNPYQPMLRN